MMEKPHGAHSGMKSACLVVAKLLKSNACVKRVLVIHLTSFAFLAILNGDFTFVYCRPDIWGDKTKYDFYDKYCDLVCDLIFQIPASV